MQMQLKDVHVGMVSCQLYTQTRRHQTPRNPPGKREKEREEEGGGVGRKGRGGGRSGEEGKRKGEEGGGGEEEG